MEQIKCLPNHRIMITMHEHIDGKHEYVCVHASIRARANSGIKTFMSALMHS